MAAINNKSDPKILNDFFFIIISPENDHKRSLDFPQDSMHHYAWYSPIGLIPQFLSRLKVMLYKLK